MSHLKFNNPKTFISLLVLAIIAAAVYGFTATNNIPESGAGEGSGVISGYTVSNIHYTLDAVNPIYLQFVTMDVAPTGNSDPASTVYISFLGFDIWFDCSSTVSPTWNCDLGEAHIPVSDLPELQVIAAQ